MRGVAKLLVALIRVYQRWISPLLGQNCRFTPTCSHYAVAALTKYGAIRGSVMAAWRILRCNPFCKGGEDPVP